MEEKYIHIVIGESAQGSLKHFLNNNKDNQYFGKVICFKDDLSIGSLYNLDENINLRIAFLKNLFKYSEVDGLNELDLLEGYIKENYYKDLDIQKDKEIVIWHGNNVVEEVALRYLVNRFEENKLLEVPVSKFEVNDYNGDRYVPKSTAQCNPEELGKLFKNIREINIVKKRELICEWRKMNSIDNNLRILKEDTIVEVDENYYDNSILSCVTREFNSVCRIIGTVMGLSEQVVGDNFLLYRIKQLIKDNKLDYVGMFGTVHNWDIKLK